MEARTTKLVSRSSKAIEWGKAILRSDEPYANAIAALIHRDLKRTTYQARKDQSQSR